MHETDRVMVPCGARAGTRWCPWESATAAVLAAYRDALTAKPLDCSNDR